MKSLPDFLLFIASTFMLSLLTGCAGVTIDDQAEGHLTGTVRIDWTREDKFIYRKTKDPVAFKPSFMKQAIVPEDMRTDGGSVPRIFWNIPGLSPWALGPAYIVRDWVFLVHRCNKDAPAAVKAITFEESAQILAEVGKSLVKADLIDNNRLPLIVAATSSGVARKIWDSPGTDKECAPVKSARQLRFAPIKVIEFTIPPPQHP